LDLLPLNTPLDGKVVPKVGVEKRPSLPLHTVEQSARVALLKTIGLLLLTSFFPTTHVTVGLPYTRLQAYLHLRVSNLDIKTRATPTTTRCKRIVHNLELTPNQLHCEINLASLQQL